MHDALAAIGGAEKVEGMAEIAKAPGMDDALRVGEAGLEQRVRWRAFQDAAERYAATGLPTPRGRRRIAGRHAARLLHPVPPGPADGREPRASKSHRRDAFPLVTSSWDQAESPRERPGSATTCRDCCRETARARGG